MEDSDRDLAKDDAEQIRLLKQLAAQALEQCNDPDILDLIYKLLTFDNIKRWSRFWLHLFLSSPTRTTIPHVYMSESIIDADTALPLQNFICIFGNLLWCNTAHFYIGCSTIKVLRIG